MFKRKYGGTFPPAVIRVMAVTAFLAGASFCFAGEDWHAQPTFYYINELPIPWFVYGILFVIGGICVLIPYVKPIGFLVGGILYTFFSLLVWAAVVAGLNLNVLLLSKLDFPEGLYPSFFAACNLTTICVLYWSALKDSIYTQVDPDRHLNTQ